jgi:hypothetical protein
MKKINIKKEGEILTLRPEERGSISHTFRILEGRATLIESPHNNTLKSGLSLTSAATVNEVSNLIEVLDTLRDIMLSQEADKLLLEEDTEIESGTWVKTDDNRFGRVKKVDWHSLKFMNRKDYQIEFPDGIGIFRRNEIEPVR